MKMSSVGKNSTYGSKDRKRVCATLKANLLLADIIYSTIQRRLVEGPCRVARPVPIQKSKHRLCQPHIPSKHRRDVRFPFPSQHKCVSDFVSSGSVCLDVINQTWSPMFDMINIFEVFLPQLLRYPNPTDPLNGEAAALLMRDPKTYDIKVKGELVPFLDWRRRRNLRISPLTISLRVCVKIRHKRCRGRSWGRRRLRK